MPTIIRVGLYFCLSLFPMFNDTAEDITIEINYIK